MKKFEVIKTAFENNGIKFKVLEDIEETKKEILKNINEKESVTFGGSITLEELGLYDEIKNKGNKVYWHWRSDELDKIEKTDIYITSSNAITQDGKLVNKDGVGNRVTSMIYGYEKVFVVVGKNKITKNYEEAIERIENIAAPLNAKRLGIKTPCVKTGKCEDCSSPERICNVETVIHKKPMLTEMIVYLVDENLGY